MKQHAWSDPPSQTAFPVAKAGYPFIFTAAFTTLIFALIDFEILALIGLFATFFICFFFRDPDRLIPADEDAVVSPADGKVIKAEKQDNCPFMDGECLKVSIFMSIFNVHINRIPYTGKVTRIDYNPGKFVSANLDKASLDNEQNAVTLDLGKGRKLGVVQIAGLVARRIICAVKPGDAVERGRRFGLICFGSRLDVYLPGDSILNVAVGDGVKSGSSILARLSR